MNLIIGLNEPNKAKESAFAKINTPGKKKKKDYSKEVKRRNTVSKSIKPTQCYQQLRDAN